MPPLATLADVIGYVPLVLAVILTRRPLPGVAIDTILLWVPTAISSGTKWPAGAHELSWKKRGSETISTEPEPESEAATWVKGIAALISGLWEERLKSGMVKLKRLLWSALLNNGSLIESLIE